MIVCIAYVVLVIACIAFIFSLVFNEQIQEFREERQKEKLKKQFKLLKLSKSHSIYYCNIRHKNRILNKTTKSDISMRNVAFCL